MWILYVLLGLLALILALAYVCYRIAFLVPDTSDPYDFPQGSQYQAVLPKMKAMTDAALALPCEDVWITARDGIRLHGRYYHFQDNAPLQIQFHGYRGNPFRDFGGGLLYAREQGCNVLLIDQRAHGQSKGTCLSMGIRERYDCLCWTEYAAARFGKDVPILLAGISMGAATVLMASALPLPENVKGIVADCGYSSPKAIMMVVLRAMKLPAPIVYPLTRLGGILFQGADMNAASPVEAVKHCKVPVLFIHGEDDRFVPCYMTLENYEACASEKMLVTVPGAGHGLCYVVDFEAYDRAAREFYRWTIFS